jgi:hypothetical protein
MGPIAIASYGPARRRSELMNLHRQQDDEKILASINELIKDIKRDPFKGSGNRSPSNTLCRAGGRTGRERVRWRAHHPAASD